MVERIGRRLESGLCRKLRGNLRFVTMLNSGKICKNDEVTALLGQK